MYSYELDEDLAEELKKLAKKNKSLFLALQKKIMQVIEAPLIGKPLRNLLSPVQNSD